MNTATLPINRTRPEPVKVSTDHWIRLEEIEEPPLTVSEAANLIDEVFDIDPCGPDIQMAKPKEEDSAPTEEEFGDTVKEEFDLALCKVDLFGGGNVTVKITQSHPGNPYKLRLSYGRIGETVRKTEKISLTVRVENATQVELESPCEGDDSFNWLTSTKPQPIKRTDNTLHWEYPATGTIGGSYLTSFDEVTVYVPQETELLAFGVKCFDKITLYPPPNPDIDEINRKKEKYCPEDNLGSSTESGDDPPDPPTHITREEWRCICSGKHAYYTYPAGYGLASEYTGNVIFDDKFGGYVDCGKITGDISTAKFYEQICCEQPSFGVPHCKKKYVKNPGGKAPNKSLVAQYGTEGVEYIGLSPADGDCGSTVYEQVLHPRNCCDEVETAVSIRKDLTPDVLGGGGHIYCYCEGGTGDYTWRTTSDKTHFSNGKKEMKGYRLTLHADEQFCGTTELSVTDGCTTDIQVVRSNIGHWMPIPWNEEFARSVFTGMKGHNTSYHYYYAINGGYQLRERIYSGGELADQTVCRCFNSQDQYPDGEVQIQAAIQRMKQKTLSENGSLAAPILDLQIWINWEPRPEHLERRLPGQGFVVKQTYPYQGCSCIGVPGADYGNNFLHRWNITSYYHKTTQNELLRWSCL